MRAIVFANGQIDDYEAVRLLLREDDLLVAADGGAYHLLALGRMPHLLVGDLDSVDATTAQSIVAAGARVEQHPREKDQTDLELAIECALRHGADEVLLVGVAGGRLDQTLANVLILAQREWGAPVSLHAGNEIAALLRGPGRMTLHGSPGATVSVLPLSQRVTGITYAGLAYPLEGATLGLGSTRGISNAMSGAVAEVSIESGLLLVIREAASKETG